MGPGALFDKSFVQSLSVDESVWFDAYFRPNVCPIFFVETLADLEKAVRDGRTPEREVQIVSSKFPEMHSVPNANHVDLCLSDLMGQHIDFSSGRVPVAGGIPVKHGGKSGVVFRRSPEAEAFARWQEQRYLDVERSFAKTWRDNLNKWDAAAMITALQKLEIDHGGCTSLERARAIADGVVRKSDNQFDRFGLMFMTLAIPRQYHGEIFERWKIGGYKPLPEFAPYAAHLVTVDVFFHLAWAAGLIQQKPSSRTDIAYLYYLPFCDVFISSDRLHQRCAPLFMRPNQSFVWGEDLKADLKAINAHNLSLPKELKLRGVLSFARDPVAGSLVASLWERHLLARDSGPQKDVAEPIGPEGIAAMRAVTSAPALSEDEIDFDPTNPDSLSMERLISKQKGAWLQLPADIQEHEN